MILKNIYAPFKTKSVRESEELQDINLHPKMLVMLFDLGYWLWQTHKVRLLVTGVHRTKEEEEAIYGKDSGKTSVHQEWRGVDVVPENRDEKLYSEMELYMDSRYPYHGGLKFTTSDTHNINQHGIHLHIQCGYAEPYVKE